jgi:hypothetical protein
MKVSTVLNAIPRYTHHQWLSELRSLAEQSGQSHRLPFAGSPPPPANINIVRNRTAGEINTQKLELKAACLGIDRLAWIFGADAEFTGLTLKTAEQEQGYFPPVQDGFDPVLLLAHITGRKSDTLDAQYAYFIDQFTGDSINRCAAYANEESPGNQAGGGDEPVQERRSLIMRNILYALQEYDSGRSQKTIQTRNIKHIRENSTRGSDGFIQAKTAWQSCTRNLPPEGKTVFNSIRSYVEKQRTGGESFSGAHHVPEETMYAAFQPLLDQPAALSKIWFDAGRFTRGLTAPHFEMELVTTAKERSPGRKEAYHDR